MNDDGMTDASDGESRWLAPPMNPSHVGHTAHSVTQTVTVSI